ncbi:putative transmembrane protein [Gordonia polyisoprenivorans VH2]|uniref:Putative transmembrane protein n=1 Tax=Gordonia polyisoprenivorans (strain DSM 44266 / VH2) TaxID=1112204 RepID=H6MUE6_GORPV|nr:CbtA family protein [Gordonia polyisoprenivorans]AFA72742.1 putative transmembrane protein [Gordonia polyisoprenivorans VH2]
MTELRVIGRGALAGLIAGILGFVFARVFAEPVINKAIDYESGRDDVLNALNQAAGRATEPDGPEIFSRTIQSTVGIATGIIGFSVAMGALVAVAYLILMGRTALRAQYLSWLIAGFGFLGIYLLPFVKYPANPPAIGHTFTIETRGQLYLAMVATSLVLLGLAVYVVHRLHPRIGTQRAILVAGVGFLVLFGIVLAVLPSLGDLSANVDHTSEFGFARAATETPQPITNILDHPLTIDGRVYAPGQIVYPGFDADVLWKFRWYSILNQALVWLVIGMVFGALMNRMHPSTPQTVGEQATLVRQ